MDYKIIRIDESNYGLFDNMVFFRIHGYENNSLENPITDSIKKELANPNLFLYAVKKEERLVGWISLVYIPKVGSKWEGHGHIYVDELWVEPEQRGNGLAKALMHKAEELKESLQAIGIRLYVNINNETAHKLYEACGYHEDGQAFFMEK